jgi:2OG-Fe(II) oxygenase superfamily
MVDFLKPPYDQSSLDEVLANNAYQAASPYPHIVIDNLFDPHTLNEILGHWTVKNDPTLEFHNDGTYVKNKKGSGINTVFSQPAEAFLWQLSKPSFLKFLEQLTGINGLIPDPYFFGGGLHTVGQGGTLAVHVDYNKHFKFKLDRRLNLLVYLNHDWTEANGGALELWDAYTTSCAKKVVPMFNRTVIFSTTSTSFHGHTDPVNCSDTETRKSIALYYFSNGRPEEGNSNVSEHSTLWAPSLGNGS